MNFGLTSLAVEPFAIVEPAGAETPVLVEVPHAGLAIDPEALATLVAPARGIARDADLHVDRLCEDAPALGATLLVAHVSRLEIDLNRAETDVDADTVEGGGAIPSPRGVLWRLTTDGAPMLERPLPRHELTRRLDTIYRPYHRAIASILERKRARFGFAIMLCAHSMPSLGRRVDGRATSPVKRADLVPGTRGRTSAAPAVIDRVDDAARAMDWSVRHDDPYKGGFSTACYGRPVEGLHAVQIEISRGLYLDEATLRIDPQGFQAVRQFLRSLVTRLAFAEPDAPRSALCGRG